MSVKVKYSIEKLDLKSSFPKEFQKILDLALIGANGDKSLVESCIPKGEQFLLKSTISNTFTGLANGINRCLRDEIPIKSMTVVLDSIKSMGERKDPYLLNDKVQLDIQSVPINQDLDYEGVTLSLIRRNTSDKILKLYTRDLKINKKLPAPMFSDNIKIAQISPGKELYIENIHVTTGINKTDSAAYSALANLNYWPVIPSEEKNKGNKEILGARKTLTVDPTEFEINYKTYRNSTKKPTYYMILACDTLIERLNNILKDVNAVDIHKSQSYTSETLNIVKNEDIYEFRFINEFFTIANMLADACYLEDSLIKFVTPAIEHPSIEVGVVKVKHPEPIKLMSNAIKRCIKDLETIKKGFKS